MKKQKVNLIVSTILIIGAISTIIIQKNVIIGCALLAIGAGNLAINGTEK